MYSIHWFRITIIRKFLVKKDTDFCSFSNDRDEEKKNKKNQFIVVI